MNTLTKMGVYVTNEGFAETIRLDWNIYWPIPRAGERLYWLGMVDDETMRHIAGHATALFKKNLLYSQQEYITRNPDWYEKIGRVELEDTDAELYVAIQERMMALYGTRVKEIQYRLILNEYKVYLVMDENK